ncbi:MAG: hypothetical protein Kow0090_15670 [Myxococcota bacterium]
MARVVAEPSDASYILDEFGASDFLELERLAAASGLESFLFARIKKYNMLNLIPDSIKANWENKYNFFLAKNIILLDIAERLERVTRKAGIKLVRIKGIAFVEPHYPDIGSRAMGDMDFLVEETQKERAEEAFREVGGRVVGFENLPPGEHEAFHHKIYTLPSTTGGAYLVELHTRLIANYLIAPVNYRALFAEAQKDESGAYRLSPAHNIIHLALHWLQHYLDADLRSLLDGCLVIKAGVVDWEGLCRDARLWQVNPTIYLYLLWLTKNWGLLLPDGILEALKPNKARLRLIEKICDIESIPSHRLSGLPKRVEQLAIISALSPSPPRIALQVAKKLKAQWFKVGSKQ